MKNKFKVGDRVRVSKNYQHQYNTCGNGTVVSTGTNGYRCVYFVKFDDKECKLSFFSYQLEKADKLKKDKPIVMVEFRPEDTHYSYKYEVGQMVTLTKSTVEWLKKYDIDHNIPSWRYGAAFEVTEQIVEDGLPAYIIDKHYSLAFFEEDLNPAPKPRFKTGQSVYLTKDTINRLNEDKIDLDIDVDNLLEIKGYYYHLGEVVYELKGIKGLYFYESELTEEEKTRKLMNKCKECKVEDLQLSWYAACANYTIEFCKRHGYKYDPVAWVGGDIGTIIEINDMFVTMDNIRYDVDNNIPSPYFENWYWKSVELYELGIDNYMNYPSYCKGAPDEWTKERMEKLRQSHKRLQEAREDLEKTIEEYKSNKMLF